MRINALAAVVAADHMIENCLHRGAMRQIACGSIRLLRLQTSGKFSGVVFVVRAILLLRCHRLHLRARAVDICERGEAVQVAVG